MADGARSDEVSFTYDPEAAYEPAETIVKGVAWVKNVGADDLRPLQNVVNIEALTELVTDERAVLYRDSRKTDSADLRVRFQYEGCTVTVEPGRVRVEAT